MTDIHRSSEALRESEARLRLALGSGGRGVWQLEPHTGKVIWDAQMHQLFGTDPASEVLSHDRFLELVHPDDRQRIEAEFAGMLKQPGHFEREFRIVQPDGRTRWIGSYGEVTCDAAGRPDCVLGVDFDITERKLAEEALARSEQELVRAVESHRAVAANMSEGLYSVDAQGLVTYINPAAERLFGWSSGELLGKKMHDITHYKHPDGSAFPAEECAGLQVLKRGTALIDFDDTFIRKDGTFFPVVYNVSPIRAKDGVVGLVVVFRDVTQEKEVRRTLEEGRARLAGIVHSAMDAIISVDEEQHIMQFNAAAEKMFGCPAASAIGQPLDRFIPARFRERHRRHVEEFGKTGVTTRSMGALNQISGRRANGEEFPIEASISQVETAGQKVFGYAGPWREVTCPKTKRNT